MKKSELVSVDEYKILEREYVQTVLPITVARHGELGERINEVDLELLEAEETLHRLKGEVHSSALLQQMGALQTNIKQLSGQRAKLERTRSRIPVSEDDLQVQFGMIWAIPRIERVRVDQGKLVYSTLPLYGKDHGNQWRRIGPFEISFELQYPIRENFTWINLDGRKECMHGPPNIIEPTDAEYGVVSCAGADAQNIIHSAGEINDYPALVAFSIRYPECAGADHNDSIMRWPLVPETDVPEWYLQQFGA